MPIGWVAGAAAVASIATGAMQSSAAKHAADQQAQSAANAQQISQQQYSDTVNRNAPFTQSGYGALSALDWGLGIGPQNADGTPVSQTQQPTSMGSTAPASMSGYFNNPQGGFLNLGGGTIGGPVSLGTTAGAPAGGQGGSTAPVAGPQGTGLGYGSLTKQFDTSDWQKLSPAYNFNVQQGQQNVLNGAASGQGALSGAAMKDLINYNQSAANNSFNDAFNQYQTQQGNIFSRLSGIAQLGQSSANNTGQQGTALAGQSAQSALAGGAYNAAGTVGSANAIAGGINSAIPWLTGSGGGSNANNNAANWDTENPNNFQDFVGGG